MIRSNNLKAFEVSVRTKEGLEVITIPASNKDDAVCVVKGKYGYSDRQIVEVC